MISRWLNFYEWGPLYGFMMVWVRQILGYLVYICFALWRLILHLIWCIISIMQRAAFVSTNNWNIVTLFKILDFNRGNFRTLEN